ncbi:type IV pilus assembly protein PilF [Orbus hercynius]|uniref:Type IV pilus assembly protein PilF n=1 Tax=Orbus hercynius TaxID=593135 RepID=A0A495RAR4_9GAMM|nr:tetratricopeptide repeat protein [Orbus hercynius]RKS84421.1 type IV pilus assembly protein PilF [Orbus hercynius]
MIRRWFYIFLAIASLSVLTGCHFTAEQQQEFDPEQAALARLKLGLGYLSQAQNPSDRSSEDIKQAHYNLTLANQYSPNNPNVMLGMAMFDQQVGEYDEADAIYQAITKMEPTNGLYRVHYGSFLCATKRYDEARGQFKQAIALERPQWKMDSLEQLGYCAIQNGDKTQADEAFQALFQYDATKRKHVEAMANVYQQHGDQHIANYLFTISKLD